MGFSKSIEKELKEFKKGMKGKELKEFNQTIKNPFKSTIKNIKKSEGLPNSGKVVNSFFQSLGKEINKEFKSAVKKTIKHNLKKK